MNFDDANERSAHAGEYVLGTLNARERAAMDARLPTDPALLAEVYAWQDRLLGLTARLSPMAVRAELWPRIAGRIGEGASARAAASAAVPTPQAANDPSWRSLRFWQATSGLAVAASVTLAVLLGVQTWRAGQGGGTQAQAAGTRYLTLLAAPGGGGTGWIVEAVAGGQVRLLPVGATPPVPEGKTLQFWTKPQGASGPTSLGLVQAGQAVTLPASSLPAVGAQQLFELTLEPAGGSPIGRPTGPIVFVGRSVAI